MGDFSVRGLRDASDRQRMYRHALGDIAIFEQMLRDRVFDEGAPSVGAEQELCLVNAEYEPTRNALTLLDAIQDDHYTNELALFNLEINLDPFRLKDTCFSDMEVSLRSLMHKGRTQAVAHDTEVLMTGILPTLQYRHLQFDYMTPEERYRTLSNALSAIRGAKFEIYMQGVDELILSLGTVLFEACNTSFQLHLQIHPQQFVAAHNWAQMIAGPVLSACVNSPLLFGNELWAESRIAIFKQSLDTRSSAKYYRKKLPRVYFGKDWLRQSPAELWKNDIMQFPLLVTSDDFEDAKTLYAQGQIPNLRAMRLHNGTTYTWNRLVYGHSRKKPHLRIECRYLPAGPSAADEIANFAFWVGLMQQRMEGVFWENMDFRYAKNNFVKAARTGLNTVFYWFGKNIAAKQLLLETLLPMAKQGLAKVGVSEKDSNYYLDIIGRRIEREQTGADWLVYNFRKLSERYGKTIAEKALVQQMLVYQKANTPVYKWDNMTPLWTVAVPATTTVEQLMTTDIFSVLEEDCLDLAQQVMEWNGIHHLPVENKDGDLVGLLTDGMLQRHTITTATPQVKDAMLDEVVWVSADERITEAVAKMKKYGLSGVPVVFQRKLVGILTQTDLNKRGFAEEG